MISIDDPRTYGSTRLGFADEKDVDLFVDTLEKFERGEITPDAWRLFRLANGVYGQRQDGVMMIRVKIPQGILTPTQLQALADVAERWSNGKGHVTTRQNVQFHFVPPEQVETAMRHLADAGLTTREACGNSVRTITTCPYAGTSFVEPFDPTPHAEALTRHLLRGPYSSTLPRKFKIAFGGCCGTDCVHAAINDLGFLARREGDRSGFRLTIGGGTATLTRSGFVAHEFLPAGEILDAAEAVVRVFHRVGNRKDKHRARLKFAIETLGREGFLKAYEEERAVIRGEGGRPFSLPVQPEPPRLRPKETDYSIPPGYYEFARTNIRRQRQPGFSTVTLRLPLGDVTTAQFRALARLAVKYGEGEIRTTHEQNAVLRYIPTWQLPILYVELQSAGLAKPGARTITDVTSCPGAASCKLAVTASRGLASLLTEFLEGRPDLAAKASSLHLKISGCPNGCGQHHIAGIGFQGGVRRFGKTVIPQYHLFLGGGVSADAATFGRLAARIPARRVPAALERLIDLYTAERSDEEPPESYFARLPLDRAAALLADLEQFGPEDVGPDDLIDLGEEKAYAVQVSAGECAV